MWIGESLPSRIPAECYRISTRSYRALPDSLSGLAGTQPRSLPDLYQILARSLPDFTESLPGLNCISTGLLLGPQWVSSPIETPIEPYEPLLSPPVEPLSIPPAEPLSEPLSKRPLRFEASRRQDSMASIRRIAYDTGKRREDAHRASSDCRLLLFRRGPERCRQKRLPLRATDKTARFGDYGCQCGHRRKSPDQSDDQKISAKPSVETPPPKSLSKSLSKLR